MKLKYWKTRINSLQLELKVLFVIASSSILLIDLWLINRPEWFSLGAELGAIYYKLCIGYITGLIFYFINVHLNAERTKVKTYKYINNKAAKIHSLCNTLISSLREAHPVPKGKTFSSLKEELSFLSDNINPQNSFELGGWYNLEFPHWFSAIDFVEKENKELTRDLLFVRDSIKSDVIVILTDIDDCISGHINLGHGQPSGNTDLEPYSQGIIHYKNLCDKLMRTINDQYKNYEDEYNESFRNNNKLND
jgi:hypothetical protein